MDVPPIPMDDSGSINQDIACKRCSYNLRGLRLDGVCPECGTPVGRSVTGDLLRFADPKWVGTVATGLNLIVLTFLFGIFLGCAAGGAAAALGGSVVIVLVASACMWVLNLIGIWMMTAPDPAGIGEDGNVSARKIVRIATVTTVAAAVFTEGIGLLSDDPGIAMLALVISLASALVTLVGEWYKFVFYERLAARIPDELIVKRAQFLRWAYTPVFAIAVVGGAVLAIVAGGNPAAAMGFAPLGIVIAGAGVLLLVVGLLTLALILRLRRLMLAQADLAKRTWAAALPAA